MDSQNLMDRYLESQGLPPTEKNQGTVVEKNPYAPEDNNEQYIYTEGWMGGRMPARDPNALVVSQSTQNPPYQSQPAQYQTSSCQSQPAQYQTPSYQSQPAQYQNPATQFPYQNTGMPYGAGNYRPYPSRSPYVQTYQNTQNGAKMGFSIAGLVFGILSIIACVFSFLDFIFCTFGITFSLLGIGQENKSGKGMAIAGLACSGVGVVLSVLITILVYLE